ncbi:hypothetical protein HN680_00075 [Candidatus Peregrinibacteria bacterium]|nr:hypothetical protein [Candidatus Peregrinibacteria bacterium]
MDLITSYFALTTDRFPLKENPEEALSPEGAFQLYLEQTYIPVPPELHFDTLKGDIPTQHHERIARTWKNVLKFEEDWAMTIQNLMGFWETAPTTTDPLATEIVGNTQLAIQERFQKAAVAVVSRSHLEKGGQQLARWQNMEKHLRKGLYASYRDYLRVLRAYYGLLLERPDSNFEGDETLPLPEDHSLRLDIVLRMRVLEYLDASHQADAVAKTVHHKQPGHRTRRTGGAYLQHPIRTRQSLGLHILPFVLDEAFDNERMHNLLAETMGGSLHDCDEDGRWSREEVIDKMDEVGNAYDSKIHQVLGSGFETPGDIEREDAGRKRLKKKLLALVKARTRRCLRNILLAVTVDLKRPIADIQKKKAVQQNLFGREQTKALLNITDAALGMWQIEPTEISEEPQSATVQKFPTSYKDKADLFLLKLALINDPVETRSALRVKMEDQLDNFRSLTVHSPETQITKLRYTLAWPIIESDEQTGRYDIEELPLGNPLGFLIDATLREYERFKTDPACNHLFDPAIDDPYIEQLKKWKVRFQQQEIQGNVRKVLDQWHAAHPDYTETE